MVEFGFGVIVGIVLHANFPKIEAFVVSLFTKKPPSPPAPPKAA